MYLEYPKWVDINSGLSKNELLDIIEIGVSCGDIQSAIDDFIEATCDGTPISDEDDSMHESEAIRRYTNGTR